MLHSIYHFSSEAGRLKAAEDFVDPKASGIRLYNPLFGILLWLIGKADILKALEVGGRTKTWFINTNSLIKWAPSIAPKGYVFEKKNIDGLLNAVKEDQAEKKEKKAKENGQNLENKKPIPAKDKGQSVPAGVPKVAVQEEKAIEKELVKDKEEKAAEKEQPKDAMPNPTILSVFEGFDKVNATLLKQLQDEEKAKAQKIPGKQNQPESMEKENKLFDLIDLYLPEFENQRLIPLAKFNFSAQKFLRLDLGFQNKVYLSSMIVLDQENLNKAWMKELREIFSKHPKKLISFIHVALQQNFSNEKFIPLLASAGGFNKDFIAKLPEEVKKPVKDQVLRIFDKKLIDSTLIFNFENATDVKDFLQGCKYLLENVGYKGNLYEELLKKTLPYMNKLDHQGLIDFKEMLKSVVMEEKEKENKNDLVVPMLL